jgi:polyferredoxin
VHVRVAPRGDGIDVLQWPIIGPFLRWRHARTAIQLVLLLAAALVVADGLFGSALDPTSFATVAIWTHYRGLLVVALLAMGNLFCMGCPFVLARDAGRRVRMPTVTLPRWLRTKWIGIVLFGVVLFCYERFGLWALPRATAWLVLAYFASAVVVDLIFTGASFCKYVCPVGQFNFVASTMSPFELRVREIATCHSCRTADCIKGNDLQRGCELRLFLPAKVGNMDCTLCLDCVHACPHDNIALAARVPGAELADPRRRSGIGRFTRRMDIAALVTLFVFGSLVNAFGMVAPAGSVEGQLVRFVFAVGVVPLVLLGLAATATRFLAGDPERVALHVKSEGVAPSPPVRRPYQGRLQVAISYAYALVPLGFGVWLAHYGFHLLTGALAIVPVTQRAAIDLLGSPVLGQPLLRLTGMRPGSVYPIEIGLILLGALGSLGVAFQISERDYPARPAIATLPWALVVASLTSAALWIISQPMQMTIGYLG